MEKMSVFSRVPCNMARDRGKQMLSKRRVYANEGNANEPTIFARWVAREFKKGAGADGSKKAYFAETTDLVLFRTLRLATVRLRSCSVGR